MKKEEKKKIAKKEIKTIKLYEAIFISFFILLLIFLIINLFIG